MEDALEFDVAAAKLSDLLGPDVEATAVSGERWRRARQRLPEDGSVSPTPSLTAGFGGEVIDGPLKKACLNGSRPTPSLAESTAEDSLANFDRMRRNRNRFEYELRFFEDAEIAADLEHARAIVTAVGAAL